MLKKLLLFTFISILSFSLSLSAKSVEKDIKKVQSISVKTEPAVFSLLFKSSKHLAKKWDQELALEISRVFAIVIDYNQNSYIIELISPATGKWKEKFEKVLLKKLSIKQKKIYADMKKENIKESREGNG